MKRFLPKFILTFAIFYICIAIYKYAIYPKVTGDLSSLRKIPVGYDYANNIHQQFPFDTTYILCWHEGMKIDGESVIVIGDSFSNREEPNQQGYQTENSWSRYAAESLGIRVINFRNYLCWFYPEQLFLSLIEERVIPDNCIVILESVERHMITRLTTPYDENYYQTYIDGLRVAKTNRDKTKNKKETDWIAETTTFIRYRLGKESPAHRFKLSQPCFSHSRYGTTLFSYYEDEANIDDNVSMRIPIMRNTLDSLFCIAKQHNIRLFYMIAADKYDIYESLIVNKHKQNHLLDYFPSNDSIINTKELLLPYILSDVQDVYRLDDTHWSPIGSKIVGEEVADRIKKLNL